MTQSKLKELIVAYRDQGLSYKEISEKTGRTEQFCRTVYSRAIKKKQMNQVFPSGLCSYCGNPLPVTSGIKPRRFCDSKCRHDYYHREEKKVSYVLTCKYCGEQFVSYGNPNKQYCSRDHRTLAERKG